MFKIKLDDENFVGKRFKDDEKNHTIHAPLAEVDKVFKLRHWLKEFYDYLHKECDNIHTFPLETVQCFMLSSEADGDAMQEWYVVEELVEMGEFRKFSGLDQSGVSVDLVSETVLAFVHWHYEQCGRKCHFADVQGNVTLTSGKLYDPEVRFADQYKEGIPDYEKGHICNRICAELGLNILTTQENEPATRKSKRRKLSTA